MNCDNSHLNYYYYLLFIIIITNIYYLRISCLQLLFFKIYVTIYLEFYWMVWSQLQLSDSTTPISRTLSVSGLEHNSGSSWWSLSGRFSWYSSLSLFIGFIDLLFFTPGRLPDPKVICSFVQPLFKPQLRVNN